MQRIKIWKDNEFVGPEWWDEFARKWLNSDIYGKRDETYTVEYEVQLVNEWIPSGKVYVGPEKLKKSDKRDAEIVFENDHDYTLFLLWIN